MRIELDLADATIERLEAKARSRGDAKVATIIAEAVDYYLRDDAEAENLESWERLEAVLDALPPGFGDSLEARVKELRANWRTSSSIPTS